MRGTLAALMLALLLPLPALAGQVTVKPGETLSEIADRYGISLSRLMSLNGLQRANHVQAGTTLRVPGSSSGSHSTASGATGRGGGGTVTVQRGQTLSEIAQQQGISLSTLMRINGISDADEVVAGQQLRLSGRSATGSGASTANSRTSAARGGASVTVQRGQTLSEIAEQQGISLSTLMRINGISDADQVVAGQQLRLPGRAAAGSGGSSAAASYPRNASVHVVRPGESLSGIANGYDLPLSRLVALNAIADPDHVEPGTRLKLQGTPAPRPAATQTSRPATAGKGSDKPASVARTTTAAPEKARATTTGGATASHPHSQATATASTTARATTASTVTASAGQSSTTGHTSHPGQHPQTAAISPAVQAQLASSSAPSMAAATAAASATPSVSSQAKAIGTSSTASTSAAITATASGAAASTAATATRLTSSRPATPSIATAGASSMVPTATRATVRSKATTSPTVATARADWRTYGPVQVNWTAWQPMGGSMVAPSLNAKGQTYYTAINCGARKLNATTVSGEWQAWSDPSAEYEMQLVTDYCRSRS